MNTLIVGFVLWLVLSGFGIMAYRATYTTETGNISHSYEGAMFYESIDGETTPPTYVTDDEWHETNLEILNKHHEEGDYSGKVRFWFLRPSDEDE